MSRIEEVIRGIRFTGFGNVLNTIPYTRFKNRLDRLYNQKNENQQPPQKPGRLLNIKSTPSGMQFRYECAALEVNFLANDLARISWEPGLPPLPYALAKTEWPGAELDLQEKDAGWSLSSPELNVEIDPEGGITFYSPAGDRLHQQLPPERRGDRGQEVAWTSRSRLNPEEGIYGLGEQAGRLNLRGAVHRMWNSDPGGSYGPGTDPLYMPIPVYLGLHGQGSYLIFYENAFPAVFELGGRMNSQPAGLNLDGGEGDICRASFEGGALQYYFIPGPPERALERYTELTGRPSLPPIWALGYHQSRWGYKTERDIREVAAGFQEHHMPLSAIHLDIDYMDGYRIFTVNQKAFPDLAGLSRELGAQGIRLVTIIDPGVKRDPDYYLYREGLEEGIFCTLPNGKPLAGLVWPGWSVFPDFTQPKARAWWGDQYPRLLESGIAGFWHDMNEPASFTASGDSTLPLATCHQLEGRGGDHREAHNLYGLLMNRAGCEGLRRRRPQSRPWLISRSGWAGNQRYAWNWTGDIESTWEGLRMTLASILGLGLSGQPFSGPDIGGFSGDPSAELYLRWFQMGAFLPYFRTHSAVTTARREPWMYGEPYTSILRQSLQLRKRLMPYLYTLAWEAAQTGHPIIRPLFWDEPEKAGLWEVDDAFLVGSAVLVAPVLEAGAEKCEVILPSGEWYSLWDGSRITGGGKANLPASLERIPVLVRGGSVLPMEEDQQLVLNLYSPGNDVETESLMYSDAGEGIPSAVADWRLDRFRLKGVRGGIELSWNHEGGYAFPYASICLHLYGFPSTRAWVDGEARSIHGDRLILETFREVRFEAKAE